MSRIVNVTRGFRVAFDGVIWDNGATTKAAQAVRQHRCSWASPTSKESTDG